MRILVAHLVVDHVDPAGHAVAVRGRADPQARRSDSPARPRAGRVRRPPERTAARRARPRATACTALQVVLRHAKLERRAVGEGASGGGVADDRADLGIEARHGAELELAPEARDRGRPSVRAADIDAGPVEERFGLLAGGRWPAAPIADMTGLARDVVEHRAQAAVLGRGGGDELNLEVLVALVVPREATTGEVRRGLRERPGRDIEHGGGAARQRRVGFTDAAGVEGELRVGGGVGNGERVGSLGLRQVVLIGTGKHSQRRDGDEDT